MRHPAHALFLVASLAPLGLVSCDTPSRRDAFGPEGELAGRGERLATPARWRKRTRHTRGDVGEDLFPSLSAAASRLYFSTSRFSTGFDLAVKDVDGYTVQFLTNGPDNDIHPAVSPDGSQLAFASDRSGRWGLYLRDTKPSGQVRELLPSQTDDLGPAWSPDGRRIAFFRRGAGSGRWEIWILDLSTRSELYVTEGLFPAWSPDGEWIAFQKGREHGDKWYSIWKIRADGSRLTDLMSGWSDRWGAVQPSWSPDGLWIAFTAVGKAYRGADLPRDASPDRLRESDIYLLSVDGSQLVDLTGDRAGSSEWNPCFAANGRVFFSARAGGSTRVWSVGTTVDPPAATPAVPRTDSSGGTPATATGASI